MHNCCMYLARIGQVRHYETGQRLWLPASRRKTTCPSRFKNLRFITLISQYHYVCYWPWLADFFVGGWVDDVVGWLPQWMSGITNLLWFLFAIFFGMAVFFSFNILANFIAAPLNGLLSEKVQQHLTGEVLGETNFGTLMASIPRSVGRELIKLTYYLPRVLLLLIFSFIPIANIIVPWLWLFFAAWMMAIQHVDYPMDNNGTSFRKMKKAVSKERFLHLGFGAGVSILLMVSVVNFAMPIAVAGATVLYVNEHKALKQAQNDLPIIHQ